MFRSVVDAAGTAVPFSVNAQMAAVPFVVQFIVEPLSVPVALPLTGTPAHVAVYAMVAVVAPVGVIVQFIEVQAPVVAVERQLPAKALIAVGVGVGFEGVDVWSHAASVRSTPSSPRDLTFTIP